MKKLTTIILCIVCIMAFVFSSTSFADIRFGNTKNDDTTLIQLYYANLNKSLGIKTKRESLTAKNWEEESTISSSYADVLNESCNDTLSIVEHTGLNNVLSIKDVEILSEIPMDYYEEYCEGIENPHLYLVRCNEEVIQNDGFNFPGTNYHVIICGDEGAERKVFDSRAPMPYLIDEYEEDVTLGDAYLSLRFDDGDRINVNAGNEYGAMAVDDPISFNTSLPSTIKVKREYYGSGEVVTVNFKTYCENVSLYELGYNSWNANALKACTLAIRNFAWHKVVTYGTSASYHLKDHGTLGAQVYNPNGGRTNSQYPNVISALNAIWNTLMVNSSKQLFLSEYRLGTSGQNGTQYGGILSQYGAKKLADEGKSYSYILGFYYSYATKRSTGAIIVCSSHSYPSSYVQTSSQHYRACTTCGYRSSVAAHSWVLSADKTKYTCSVCGYTTNLAGGISSLPPTEALLPKS